MAEGNTKDLTDREILEQILARLSALEAAESERSKETRPKLDSIHKAVADLTVEMGEVKGDIKEIRRRLETLAIDVLDMRGKQRDFDDRLLLLERKPS
jgi:hypothetical protein